MSTLPFRSLHVSPISLRPAVSRVVSVLGSVLDVFAEAEDIARVARKRYPFAEG
jgi:hypothetical protein